LGYKWLDADSSKKVADAGVKELRKQLRIHGTAA
jgi:hypothetical protein